MGSSEQKSGTERSEGSNFAFLQRSEPLFFQLGSTAERLFPFDPNASLLKLRQLGEAMAQSIAARVGVTYDERTTQSDLLYAIARRAGFDSTVRELFHALRIEGNRAAHDNVQHRHAATKPDTIFLTLLCYSFKPLGGLLLMSKRTHLESAPDLVDKSA